MKRGFSMGLTLMAVLCVAQVSIADSAKYPLTGLLKTGSQTGTGTTPVTLIANTDLPSTASGTKKVLVLSQACFQVAAGNTVTLTAGSIVVPFAYANANGGTACLSFGPGYVVPEDTDVTCAATGTNNFTCSVSGVVTRLQ